jgi:2-polyprenyl-3-methyl-5-hydroxy-6-metoxy-1,4-benzoquinol methylase
MASELYEYGYAKEVAEKLRVPTCASLVPDRYELVTAIEVLEHMLSPVDTLNELCSTIKVGGYLVVTTGNLSKHKGKIADWSYVKTNPDVHISFFSPMALHKILKEMGFEQVQKKFHRDLILSKILKNLLILMAPRSETFFSKYLYKMRFLLIWLVPILDEVKGVSEIGIWKKVEE